MLSVKAPMRTPERVNESGCVRPGNALVCHGLRLLAQWSDLSNGFRSKRFGYLPSPMKEAVTLCCSLVCMDRVQEVVRPRRPLAFARFQNPRTSSINLQSDMEISYFYTRHFFAGRGAVLLLAARGGTVVFNAVLAVIRNRIHSLCL